MTQDRLWKSECPFCQSPETFCCGVYSDHTDWICWSCLVFFKKLYKKGKVYIVGIEPKNPENLIQDPIRSEQITHNAVQLILIMRNTMSGWLNEHYYHPRFWAFLVTLDVILDRFASEFQFLLEQIEKLKQNKQEQNPPSTQ